MNTPASFSQRVEQYAHGVCDERIVAGELTRLACARQLTDLERWANGGPYVWSPAHVEDVCSFVELLPHVEGVWETPNIQLLDWMVFLLGCVFGWRRAEDGGRRFSDVYVEVGRKNAKSTLTAAVALYCLTSEDEPGVQVKCAATTGKQARIVFGIAKRMVERTPALREAYGLEAWANAVTCSTLSGNMEPINAKASTQDGLNPHLAVLDELHAHKERALYDVLKSARAARRNPLTWSITTAGYNIEGVAFEQRRLVERVLKGVLPAEHYFGVIYTLDNVDEPGGDNPYDPAVWVKANPSWGVSVSEREMKAYAEEARSSPDTEVEFKTKRLNLWLGSRAAWVQMAAWDACRGDVDLDALAGVRACAGLDLASVGDITAWALVWLVDERAYVRLRMWVPEDVVEPRTERQSIPYRRWVDEGWLTTTPGNVTDYAVVERDIRADLDAFNVGDVAYDPWNAYDLVNRLTEAGAEMVEFRQGVKSYAPAMRALKRHITARTLVHDGNPVLGWMASNFVARRDVNDNEAPDRRNSAGKIDGVVALLMALARATATAEEPDGVMTFSSDYEVALA